MGKNHGKGNTKTPVAKWDSLMRKTENELAQKKTEAKKGASKN